MRTVDEPASEQPQAAAPSSNIGSNTVRTFLFTILSSVIGIGTGIYLAKTLGPTGKGFFSGLQTLQGGIGAVTGGAGGAITYMLSNQRRSLAQMLPPLGLLFVLTTALAWVGLALWGLHSGLTPTVLIAAAIIPASIILSWRSTFYVGLNQVKTLNAQAFGLSVCSLVAIVMAVQVLHAGVVGALVAWSLCIYCGAALVTGHAVRMAGHFEHADFWSDTKTLLSFGSRSALDGLMGFLNYRIDSIVLIAYLGAAGFGIYSIAVTGGELVFMISRSVALAASHDIASRERIASAELTAKSIRLSTFVVAIVAAVLWLVGPWVITFVYGDRFQAAGLPLRILLVGTVVYAAGGSFSSFVVYQLGRPMVFVYVSLVMIVLQAGLSIALIPRVGLTGAAIASTVTYVFAAIVVTVYFSRISGLRPSDIWILRRDDLALLRFWLQRILRKAR